MHHSASASRSAAFGFSILSVVLSLPLLAQPGEAVLVKAAVVRNQSLAPVTFVPATVVSRSDAQLSAEVEGRLVMVAEVGDTVVTGDILAIIEDRGLQLLKLELEAEVVRAEARLKFLESELQRFSTLAESNLAAVNQLELTRSERDAAVGDLDVAKARLAQNQDKLSKTRLLAPHDGIVVERLMTPGERVTEGSPVVRLVDQNHLEVIARAPLDYFTYVQRGQVLELRDAEQTLTGMVRTVVAVGDENTHLFELRIDLEGHPFPVGQTLKVAVPTSDSREVLSIPRDALVLRSDGQRVFVIDDNNQAQEVSVKTGTGEGETIEVIGDLAPGDRVVIRGNERLQAGQTVQILDIE